MKQCKFLLIEKNYQQALRNLTIRFYRMTQLQYIGITYELHKNRILILPIYDSKIIRFILKYYNATDIINI
ncbi:unnamed protein product [Paramecium sonneborni]|uniref:Uncharacterized protein n=1 Tax=Paramecium sonneborni TaxID=65129 RepID=A0A8S1KL58_9CILI|nr:unnamed protein product [Paramecium sonneborni]